MAADGRAGRRNENEDMAKERKHKASKAGSPERAQQLGEVTAEIVNEVKQAQKPKRGRPTKYVEANAVEILTRVAGGETLRQVCRSEHLPAESTVRLWALDDVQGFAARFARGRMLMLDCWADGMVDISDDGSNDWETRKREDGSEYDVVNQEVIARAKLRIETRRWLMSKLRPDRYGEKVQVDTPKDGNLVAAFAVTGHYLANLAKAPPA